MELTTEEQKIPKKNDPVSDFFRHASKEEKVRVFREVARAASEDQRKLLKEYERKLGATPTPQAFLVSRNRSRKERFLRYAASSEKK